MSTAGVVDRHMRLAGDEDCGVSLCCNICDRGGLPIAFYEGINMFPYAGRDVEHVTTIIGLAVAAERHMAMQHPDAP